MSYAEIKEALLRAGYSDEFEVVDIYPGVYYVELSGFVDGNALKRAIASMELNATVQPSGKFGWIITCKVKNRTE